MSADTRKPVVVIGLGRFGSAVATSLERTGHEVLGIDTDAENVRDHKDLLTQVVQADATEPEALRQLGVAEFDTAVVGIGTNIEASLLIVLALVDLGLPNIWAKANTDRHGRILERTGAHHVVFPERKMGERVARLVNERLLDFISFDDEFSIARLRAPTPLLGLPLVTSQCRKKHNVTVVGIKRAGENFIPATPDTIVLPEDELVVSGLVRDVERFSTID